MLVGLAAADDAAVYRLNDNQYLISTVDFFPPIVDDPYDFGAIAAANALSDVYAMGGRALFAINLVAFPTGLGLDYLREILRGGADKVAEAGAVIAGGHSITDIEPKYGLAVTGLIENDHILTKARSSPGDILFLTKRLGTGLVTTALKNRIAAPEHVGEAVESMKLLNARAAEAAKSVRVVSATDVTGFGLLGHAHEMAHLSGVNFRIFAGQLTWLPGSDDYALAGSYPGGMFNNLNYFSPWIQFDEAISQQQQEMLWTPETSGGLLISVPKDQTETFGKLFPGTDRIGEVVPGDGRLIVLP